MKRLRVRERPGGICPQVGDDLLQWENRRDLTWQIVIHRPADDTWWAAITAPV